MKEGPDKKAHRRLKSISKDASEEAKILEPEIAETIKKAHESKKV